MCRGSHLREGRALSLDSRRIQARDLEGRPIPTPPAAARSRSEVPAHNPRGRRRSVLRRAPAHSPRYINPPSFSIHTQAIRVACLLVSSLSFMLSPAECWPVKKGPPFYRPLPLITLVGVVAVFLNPRIKRNLFQLFALFFFLFALLVVGLYWDWVP